MEVWPVLTMIAARGAKKRAARGGKYDTLGVTDRSNCLSNQLLYITKGFLLIWVSGPLLKRAPNLNIVQYLTEFNYKRL